jgi:hypothetical protein
MKQTQSILWYYQIFGTSDIICLSCSFKSKYTSEIGIFYIDRDSCIICVNKEVIFKCIVACCGQYLLFAQIYQVHAMHTWSPLTPVIHYTGTQSLSQYLSTSGVTLSVIGLPISTVIRRKSADKQSWPN